VLDVSSHTVDNVRGVAFCTLLNGIYHQVVISVRCIVTHSWQRKRCGILYFTYWDLSSGSNQY